MKKIKFFVRTAAISSWLQNARESLQLSQDKAAKGFV